MKAVFEWLLGATGILCLVGIFLGLVFLIVWAFVSCVVAAFGHHDHESWPY